MSYFCAAFGVLSIIVGSVGAMYQISIKRLVAYSSVTHTGFILLAIASGFIHTVTALVIYLVLYVMMSLNLFLIIFILREQMGYSNIRKLLSLRKLLGENAMVGCSLILCLFSMAGVPPLLGFYGKYIVIWQCLSEGLYLVAYIALFMSALSVVYYLYVVKDIIYNPMKDSICLCEINTVVAWLLVFVSFFNFFFFIFSEELFLIAELAWEGSTW